MERQMIGSSGARLSIAVATALLLLSACGGDGLLRPARVIEGFYTLRQVDGHNLPRTVSNDGASRVDIVSGDVELDEASWVGRTEFRITTPSGVSTDTQIGSGSWSLQGDSIRFDAFASVMGVVRGDSLRVIRRTNGTESVFLYLR